MFEKIEPVSITARAAAEIKKIMEAKRIPPDHALRIGIRGGGCGATLIIGFDTLKETDQTYTIADIPVYINKHHLMFLIGKEVDFYEGEEGRGFLFREG